MELCSIRLSERTLYLEHLIPAFMSGKSQITVVTCGSQISTIILKELCNYREILKTTPQGAYAQDFAMIYFDYYRDKLHLGNSAACFMHVLGDI